MREGGSQVAVSGLANLLDPGAQPVETRVAAHSRMVATTEGQAPARPAPDNWR